MRTTKQSMTREQYICYVISSHVMGKTVRVRLGKTVRVRLGVSDDTWHNMSDMIHQDGKAFWNFEEYEYEVIESPIAGLQGCPKDLA